MGQSWDTFLEIIFAIFNLFIRGVFITSQVTGSRWHSKSSTGWFWNFHVVLTNNSHGGHGPDIDKFQQLLKEASSFALPASIETTQAPLKKIKIATDKEKMKRYQQS